MRKYLLALVIFTVWAFGFRYFLEHPNLRQGLATFTRSYQAEPGQAEIEQQDSPQPLVAASPEPPVNRPDPVLWENHGPDTEARCTATPTRDIAPESTPTVYRWVDDDGGVHYGDRPPAGSAATLYTSQSTPRMQYFQLDFQYIGQNQAPYLRGQLQVGVTRIYESLKGLVGAERLRQVELNVRLFQRQEDYSRHAQVAGSARSANAGGFYSTQSNEAVTFQYPDNEQTLSVLRHESVHVIVAGMLGTRTPMWLNEGLAVYFENLQVAGQYGDVSINEYYLALARESIAQGYPRRLMDVLTLGADEWYGPSQAAHYALGWSLVYFLMDSAQGRRALAALLQEKADNYCGEVDQRVWLAGSSPGGVDGLQGDFWGWIGGRGSKGGHRH